MREYIRIIGVDCATEAKNTGLALGRYIDGNVELLDVKNGKTHVSISEELRKWIGEEERVLIAMDAPLGWPKGLGDSLSTHNAGVGLNIDANSMFRRATDKFIKATINQQPLDVGADRIARTAYTAVNILSELRQITRKEINLVWNKDFNGIGVIEVYPAATLSCYSINNKNYKKPIQKEARIEIRKKLSKQLEISCDTKLIEENADALDSAICLLAAKDFLNGHVYYPGDIDIAQKEGWIWVRK